MVCQPHSFLAIGGTVALVGQGQEGQQSQQFELISSVPLTLILYLLVSKEILLGPQPIVSQRVNSVHRQVEPQLWNVVNDLRIF